MKIGQAVRTGLLATASMLILGGSALAQTPAPAPEAPALKATAALSSGGANAATLLLNPSNPAASLIAGTAELGGVELYDLGGQQVGAIPAGEAYALDSRAGVTVGDRTVTLLAALDRKANQVRLFSMDGAKATSLDARPIAFGFPGEGLCLYRSARDQGLYAFIIGADGLIEQWLLFGVDGGKLDGRMIRRLHLPSEASHCVVDDAAGAVYVTEDAVGIWRFDADPETDATPRVVDIVRFGKITEEVGGVALIDGGKGARWLVAGNATDGDFNLYDRNQDDRFVGRFRIEGVKSAAGLTATRAAVGEDFPQGLLVVADDRKAGASYRLVSLAEVAKAAGVSAGEIQAPATIGKPLAIVRPSVETTPVASGGDAADDPAIWIHPTDPALSVIIGTDKKRGLNVYDLKGQLLQSLDDGKLNNVDLRDGFKLGGRTVTLVAASDRTSKAIALYALDPATRRLTSVADGVQATGLGDPYGLCMYRSRKGETFVFINDTDGRMKQWKLSATPTGKVRAEEVRAWAFDTQVEGCVADDETAALYVAEEDVALWRMGAEPSTGVKKTAVATIKDNPFLHADLEGVGLYAQAGGKGYIVVSSQGDNSYAVFRREGSNAYVGSFAVVADGALGIDGVSETDGLDITSRAVGPGFPQGLMVAQDGRNIGPPEHQNFKLISWERVAAALGLK